MSLRPVRARIFDFLNWCSWLPKITRHRGSQPGPSGGARSSGMKITPDAFEPGWPCINQSDIPRVCREICDSVAELERAFKRGELATALTTGCFEKTLGPDLYSSYAKLAGDTPTPEHLQHIRAETVRTLLAQFQNDLIPRQIAHTQTYSVARADTPTRNVDHFELADASFDGVSAETLRIDQMLDARFWGIGFSFETPSHGDFFARLAVRTSVRRLASELRDLQNLLEHLRPKMLTNEFKILPEPANRRFEHLILDILNEDARHAWIARLKEDFLEKTDLRVKYAGLNRSRGARVQLTLITAPALHESKLRSIRSVEELVFLSPRSLAEFANSLPKQNASATAPSFRTSSLWDCFEKKPTNVPWLASELKQILLSALSEIPASPLGPMVRIPLPVRQLIRHFVESCAFESTNRLRTREKLHGQQRPPSRRRRCTERVKSRS